MFMKQTMVDADSNEKASAPQFDLRGKRIYVAGHRGMMGSAIVRRLADEQSRNSSSQIKTPLT